jgi:benzodiazapine receptor
MQALLLTLAPLLVSFAVSSRPGVEYSSLKKPAWTPPPIVFPIVWTCLYLGMGYASARVASVTGLVSLPILAYVLQIVLNISWTPIFFGRGAYAKALTVLRYLIVVAATTMYLFWQVDRAAGLLFVPYLAWLGVAHELNRAIVSMNGR